MLAQAVITPFERVARLRGGRALHPAGRSFAATLRSGLISGPHEHEVAVRFSKAAGTPGGLPDVLGVAFRVLLETAWLDVLFSTTGSLPGARHVLLPRRSFMAGTYCTLLPYEINGGTRVIALLPAQQRHVPARLDALDDEVKTAPLVFRLATARLTGPWEPCGDLEIHSPVPDVDSFDPQLNNLAGLRPTGPLQAVRRLAYMASRRGRGATSPIRPPAARRTKPTTSATR